LNDCAADLNLAESTIHLQHSQQYNEEITNMMLMIMEFLDTILMKIDESKQDEQVNMKQLVNKIEENDNKIIKQIDQNQNNLNDILEQINTKVNQINPIDQKQNMDEDLMTPINTLIQEFQKSYACNIYMQQRQDEMIKTINEISQHYKILDKNDKNKNNKNKK